MDRKDLGDLVVILTSGEIKDLKEGHLHKVWRYVEPKHAEVGKCYVAGGEKYTVIAHKRLARSAVAAKVARLIEAWPPGVEEAWVVEIAKGDLTDKDRYLLAGAPLVSICQAPYKWPDGKRRPSGRGYAQGATTCFRGHKRPAETIEEDGYTYVESRRMRGEPPAVRADVQDQYAKAAEAESAAKRKRRRKQPKTYRA